MLLIHLGALGAVVRSTALPNAIRRSLKGRSVHLTWITDAPAGQLLKAHPDVDCVLETSHRSLLELMGSRFDFTFVVDKGRDAMGLVAQLGAERLGEVRGFRPHPVMGNVPWPATSDAEELYAIGLSNELKFQLNRKTENQLIHEALGLGRVERDRPRLYLTASEQQELSLRRSQWIQLGGFEATSRDTPKNTQPVLIGLNTGCAETIPYKKLTVAGHVELIQALNRLAQKSKSVEPIFVLLGGGESDKLRNREIAKVLDGDPDFQGQVIESETLRGLRDGMISVAACDVLFSGDSLGMHMGIALDVPTVAWFGPTCAHEIDFFGRGEALLTRAQCSPCWRRSCDQSVMCYDQIDFQFAAQRILHFAQLKLKAPQKEVVTDSLPASDIQL